MTANTHKLSLPKSIISNNDNDTFSQDLLRQFDKKRSRLHFELGFTSQEPSPETSTVNNTSYINEEPIQLDNAIDEDIIIDTNSSRHQPSTSCASKRSSSASDMLRRSSAYLKSKFDLLKKNRSQDEYYSRPRSTIIEPSTKPTKLLMKTTISIPSMAANYHNHNNMTPPTITQYPPKPLVYSPIEPIPTMSNESKPLLHRISMPLMRVYNQDSPLTRNKSISSLVTRRRKSEPDGHTKRKLRRK